MLHPLDPRACRRIANRESARRVRQKRSELMDELQIKCTALGQQNARLLSHVAVVESQKNLLAQQVGAALVFASQENTVILPVRAQRLLAHRLLALAAAGSCHSKACPALPCPSPLWPCRWACCRSG